MNLVDYSVIDFAKGNGLVPVITQDTFTKEVLMLAYANKDAIEKTQATGVAHYYSRSRQSLWKKGESSGNTQKIVKIFVDCDQDTLIYLVEQKGVACHTGNKTCFFTEISSKQ